MEIISQVKITGLSHEGRGIAQINGKIVFVDNALPDEIADIQITRKNKKFSEAKIIRLLETSPRRIIPKCAHFEICGGCQLQHLDQHDQILLKQNNLLLQLKHGAHINTDKITLLEPVTAHPWGYRHKARLSVKYVEKKQRLLIGFHEKNGRYIADISRCEVLHPKIGLNIELLKSLIFSLSVLSYKNIPQIETACDEQHAVLIIRHLVDLPEADKILLKNFAQQHDFYIYLQPNKPDKITRLYPEAEFDININKNNLSYQINQIRFYFSPEDFTQINPQINTQMVNLAIKLLDLNPEDHILDLFCGLGNFSLPIAAQGCHSVTGIEGDKNMVQKAAQNAVYNQLCNTAFYTANLFEPDKNMPWINKKYSKILLDPPRTGAIEMLPYIHSLSPEKIIYISCNPATFARDAGELVNQYGYRLTQLAVMDMFAQTKHIESLAVFIK